MKIENWPITPASRRVEKADKIVPLGKKPPAEKEQEPISDHKKSGEPKPDKVTISEGAKAFARWAKKRREDIGEEE